jgi:hypothetical protein
MTYNVPAADLSREITIFRYHISYLRNKIVQSQAKPCHVLRTRWVVQQWRAGPSEGNRVVVTYPTPIMARGLSGFRPTHSLARLA